MAKVDSPLQLVVCDAGPLIHLDELDCLGLFADFAEVFVPSVVWEEVEHHRPQVFVQYAHLFKRCEPVQPIQPDLEAILRLFSLHAGEMQALEIAQEQRVDLLLTDDTAARLAASSLKIAVHGSIGILLRSIRRKQKTAAEVVALLRSLPTRSSLHLKASLLAEIIQQIEQSGL